MLRTAGLKGTRDVGESERPRFCEEPYQGNSSSARLRYWLSARVSCSAQVPLEGVCRISGDILANPPVLCILSIREDEAGGNLGPGQRRALVRTKPAFPPNILKPRRGAGPLRHVCCFNILSAEPVTKRSKWHEQISRTATGLMVWEDSLFISYVLWIFFFLTLFKEHFYKLVFYIALPVLREKINIFNVFPEAYAPIEKMYPLWT